MLSIYLFGDFWVTIVNPKKTIRHLPTHSYPLCIEQRCHLLIFDQQTPGGTAGGTRCPKPPVRRDYNETRILLIV